MKKIYLFAILILALQATVSAQTTHTITTSGLAFSPDSVAARVGDIIMFNVDFSTHPLQQVSSATWAANQATPLAGGFSATSGNSYSVTMTQAGTIYYVCTQHVASFGMKGRIFVSAANGIDDISFASAAPYPNPAARQLHLVLASSGDVSYTITDMLGQNVLEGTQYVQGMMTVDVSAITEGAYILSVTDAEGMVSRSKVDIRR